MHGVSTIPGLGQPLIHCGPICYIIPLIYKGMNKDFPETILRIRNGIHYHNFTCEIYNEAATQNNL